MHRKSSDVYCHVSRGCLGGNGGSSSLSVCVCECLCVGACVCVSVCVCVHLRVHEYMSALTCLALTEL